MSVYSPGDRGDGKEYVVKTRRKRKDREEWLRRKKIKQAIKARPERPMSEEFKCMEVRPSAIVPFAELEALSLLTLFVRHKVRRGSSE